MGKTEKARGTIEFRAASKDKPAEILIYGPIESARFWGDETTPRQFREDLDALGDVEEIHIYVNSPGGDTFAGQAIYSILKRFPARKIGHIDGLAASAAADVVMACDTIIMPKNAMMMVHRSWTVAVGNADDFAKLAKDMQNIDRARSIVYQEKTGKTEEEIIAILAAETWMNGEEAVEAGFADEIEESKEIAASLADKMLTVNGRIFDLSHFQTLPKIAAAPKPERSLVGINGGRHYLAAVEAKIEILGKG